MANPVVGLGIVATYVAKKGITEAVKKYGKKAVAAVYKADKSSSEELFNVADGLDAFLKDKKKNKEKKENKTPPKKNKPNMAIRKGANNYAKNKGMA